MSKELHLSRIHSPYNNRLEEHFCRRWVSVTAIQELRKKKESQVIAAQISRYEGQKTAYFCVTIAQASNFDQSNPSSVTIGMLINAELLENFRFIKDPLLPERVVNTTCERCAITDCKERVASASVINKSLVEHQIETALNDLSSQL
jgi:hypothetical protein